MTTSCRLVGPPHPQPRLPVHMIGQHIMGRRDVPSPVAANLAGLFSSLRRDPSTIMREFDCAGYVS